MLRMSKDHVRDVMRTIQETIAAGTVGTPPPMSKLQEIYNILAELLDRPNHPDELVDTMVGLISDPRISRIDGSRLELLRRSVLSPRELAQFKSGSMALMRCGGCDRELLNEEVITRSGNQLFCWECARPQIVRCRGCEEEIDVSGINRTIQRVLHGKHQCRANGPQPTPVGPPPPSTITFAPNDPGENWSTVGQTTIAAVSADPDWSLRRLNDLLAEARREGRNES